MTGKTLIRQEAEKSTNKLELATKYHREYLLKGSAEQLTKAIECYIEAINDDPFEASAYYRLALLMYENKQIGLESAIEQCQKAVRLEPENPDARMYLGYFLSLKGEDILAKQELKKAVSMSPKGTSRAKMLMAINLLEKKNISNFLKGAYCLTQATIESVFDKAAIKMFAKNVLEDINYLKYSTVGKILETFKKDKDAYSVYLDALDNSKNAPCFYEKMAKIAIRKNRPSVALECYQNAHIISNYDPEKLVNTIEFIQRAYPENIDELIDYYNILVEKIPNFARPYYDLGHLYLRKGDYISASNAFRFAIDYEKDNPFYLNSLAYTYVQLEQYDAAIDLYKKAIKLNPDNEWTSIVEQALSAIYFKVKGDYEAAITCLEHALTLTKEKGGIYSLFGDIYFENENAEASIKYYNMSLQEGVKDSKIYSRLAMAYWQNNHIEDAINGYKQAINEDENYDVAYNNLGVIYLDSINDIQRALDCFEKAVELKPDYMLAHFNLGRCYDMMNLKIEAAKEYQKAIDLNNVTNEIDEAEIQTKLHELFRT